MADEPHSIDLSGLADIMREMLHGDGLRPKPSTRVVRSSVSIAPPPVKTPTEMRSQVRILHPDAIAVMRNGNIVPLTALMCTNRGGIDSVPLLLLNPDELSPDAIRAQINNPRNLQRIHAVFNTGISEHPARDYSIFRKAIARLQRPDIVNDLQRDAQKLVDFMHAEYPPSPVHLHAFFEGRHAIASMEKRFDAPLIRHVTKWFGNRAREKLTPHANVLQDALEDGCAPNLSPREREQLEANLRQRLDQLPQALLTFMHLMAIPLWAADNIEFNKSSYIKGMANANHGIVSMLSDVSMGVLIEELVHTADNTTQFTRTSGLPEGLFNTYTPPTIPNAERAFLDDLLKIYLEKQPIFEKGSHYAVPDALTGQAKYAKQDSAGAEYLANLVHAHTLPLGEASRAVLGTLLNRHFPDKFPEKKPYNGEMGELLETVIPRSIGFYYGFLHQLDAANANLQNGKAPDQAQRLRIRG